MNLQLLIDKGLSLNDIAKEIGVSKTTAVYRLKKLGIKTKHKNFVDSPQQIHKCKCGETDISKFYGHKKQICKECHRKYTSNRTRKAKAFAISLKGGKCQRCGYSKSNSALEFHHIDPTIKDKSFSSMTQWSNKKIEKELEGCILLCANCHREEHEHLRNTEG